MILTILLCIGLDSLRLNESKVIADKVSKEVPIQVIDASTIKSIPSSSVADALKYCAGVQIKDYGGLGGQKTVNVRSLGAQHVGVYIDGIRVTNVQNGTVDLGKFSLQNMESVEVCNANKVGFLMSASEFASGSTVYLNTVLPKKTEVATSYQLGSFNTHRVSATASLKKYFRLDTEYCHSDGNYPYRFKSEYEDTTGVRRNSDITFFRGELTGYYKNLRAHFYHYNSVRGLPGGVVRRLSDKYTDVGREWDRNIFIQAAYSNTWKDHSVKFNAKYEYDFLHYRSDYPENVSVHQNNIYIQQDAYISAVYSWAYKFGGISASTDLRWTDLVCDVKNFSYVYRIDSKTSLLSTFRYRGFNASINALYTDVTDRTESSAKPLRKFTGSVHLSYLYKNLTIRTFYKQIFRAPTINDLYYTMVGNRNLKPELTDQFDFGLSYVNSWCNLQADFYYNHVKDRIICLPLKGTYQYTMLNYGYTRCMGMNLSATFKYKVNELLISVTHQDDRDRTSVDLESYNHIIPYSPKWSITGVYTVKYKSVQAAISHMFVSSRYWTVDNSIEPPLRSYNCTDFKFSYSVSHITASVEVQDIFDVQYQLINRWPMPGRRYSCSLKLTF